MAKKKKKRSNTPRHKRLNRQSRVQAAKHWIPKYEGKNLVNGYSKHFGVNKLTAVYELELLGYTFKESYKQKLRESERQKQRKAEERNALKKQQQEEDMFPDSDETFAFIAGYTEGGVPFGITLEDWEEDETVKNEKIIQAEKRSIFYKKEVEDDDLPF
ncbi:hypothetical protein [Ornithinibacillus halotolerans]|uniref:Uncharacterized protein n=1 Tax=Ornithinibacillus halotolerans TaxID=1274357 RepID=A0A916RRJ4_9BACI|nr:hypothetical protein [Ornithinibacillus halotolerans]GGA66818.1 hypothetical protein GCM10008025_08350 [Ornithinibacillus halotolerans]